MNNKHLNRDADNAIDTLSSLVSEVEELEKELETSKNRIEELEKEVEETIQKYNDTL